MVEQLIHGVLRYVSDTLSYFDYAEVQVAENPRRIATPVRPTPVVAAIKDALYTSATHLTLSLPPTLVAIVQIWRLQFVPAA